jgi:hypothetical protein
MGGHYRDISAHVLLQRTPAGRRTAVAWFERFFNPDIAMRVLSPEGREILGNPDRWKWCYRRILCCLIFGWLVCRGPRAIRGLRI